MIKKYTYLFIIIGLIGVLSGLFLFYHNKHVDLEQFHGTLLTTPREIQAFSLTGIDGKTFDQNSLKGHWSILFFGFTRCGSMCPTAMGELAKMYRHLVEDNIEPKPLVVMITIDPKRDTLDKLQQYVHVFHPDFFGARAPNKTLKALTKELGIAYTTVTRTSSLARAYQDIEHTGAFLFFNPRGQLVAFSTPPHHADQLVEDYRLLIQ